MPNQRNPSLFISARSHYSIIATHSSVMPQFFFPELSQLSANTNIQRDSSNMMHHQSSDTQPLSPRDDTNMNPSSPRQLVQAKHRSTIIAVGGFVVGATAAATMIGIHNALQEQVVKSLRGGNDGTYSPTTDTDTISGPNSSGAPPLIHKYVVAATTNTTTEIANATTSIETPNAVPSTTAPTGKFPTYQPTQQLPTLLPTFIPTFDGQFPTEVPTTQDELIASDIITTNSILRSIEVGVRLKLFWEQGYFWQESVDEKW